MIQDAKRATPETVPAGPGCYALVLALGSTTHVDVGRLGPLELLPGYYIYVGSAFGPGGLRARLSRHWAGASRRYWHIDYLRAVSKPVSAWFQVQRESREHEWAAALARGRSLDAVPGFGCSDCRCVSHLYHSAAAPSFAAFRRRLGRSAEGDGSLQHCQDREL